MNDQNLKIRVQKNFHFRKKFENARKIIMKYATFLVLFCLIVQREEAHRKSHN